MRYRFPGGCHCGAVHLTFTTDIAPSVTEVRACQCDFCRRQDSKAISDPLGFLEIGCHEPASIRRYRFALGKADYLSCATCGIYLGAVTRTDEQLRGFTLVRVLADRDLFGARASAVRFDGEASDERQARRALRWTPTLFHSREGP